MAGLQHRKLRAVTSTVARRLISASAALAIVLSVGTTGYHALGDGRWTWFESLYMTVTTLATVGYGELLPGMDTVPLARAWTVGLIVLGSGSVLYFVSTLTALIVEGDLRNVLRNKRMLKKIEAIENHVIVCGIGTTGIHVVEELDTCGVPYVVIERDAARIERVLEEHRSDLLYVIGDAAEDIVLEAAGIRRARGIVAALHDDRNNLFVTVSARALNPNLRIVSRAVEHSAGPKLMRAGADAIVSPNFIGGMRLVSEMVRPHVVQFLDQMLRDKDDNLRVEEAVVSDSSRIAGKSLAECELRRIADVLVVAIRERDGRYVYNPKPEATLQPGAVLIVLGRADDVARLRKAVG